MIPSDSIDPAAPPDAGVIPEHMVILLLEGGQRFLAQAQEAMLSEEPMLRDHYLKKVLAILQELNNRLNPEQAGDLVVNLAKVYEWWGREILAAGESDDVARLKIISAQMGEIRKAWGQWLFRGEGLTENPEF